MRSYTQQMEMLKNNETIREFCISRPAASGSLSEWQAYCYFSGDKQQVEEMINEWKQREKVNREKCSGASKV